MSEDGAIALRRMLLALDAIHCEAALIEAAFTIAAKIGLQLDVLFVEDSDICAVAELPITQEISLFSATERDISSERVEQTLRARSRGAQRHFTAALARSRMNGRFSVLRAPRSQALVEAATQVDVLLLAPAESSILPPPLRGTPRHARIFAICGSSPASWRALELAARLAHQDHGVLDLICRGDPAAEQIAQLERSGLLLRLHRLDCEAPLGELLRQVETRPGNTLLIASDLGLGAESGQLIGTLAGLRCRVLLIN